MLAEIFSQFYEKHAQNLRSFVQARIALGQWLDFFGEATLEEAVIIERQEQFHAWLRDEKNLAHNSIHRVVAGGKAAISWSWRRGMIASLPYVIPIPLKPAAPKGAPLSLDEVTRLFDHAAEQHLQWFMVLMIGTAARPEAIFDLTFAQCDTTERLIVLNPADCEQTKEYRPTVKMPEALHGLVAQEQHAHAPSDTLVRFHGKKVSAVKSSWNRARDAAGLDSNVQPYSLRHAMARWLRKSGVPAWEVAARLDHKQRAFTTTEIYAPFSPDYLEASAIAIDTFFDQTRVKSVASDAFLRE